MYTSVYFQTKYVLQISTYLLLFLELEDKPVGYIAAQVNANAIISNQLLFFAVYAPDMPTRLPVTDFVSGLVRTILRAVRFWFHYILVACAWLGVVPLTACKYEKIKVVEITVLKIFAESSYLYSLFQIEFIDVCLLGQ